MSYFIIKHYIGGVRELAEEFEPVRDKNIVIEAKEKLAGKFASENHAGPKDVADFMDLEDEESIEMTKRDAYKQVQLLLLWGIELIQNVQRSSGHGQPKCWIFKYNFIVLLTCSKYK